MSWLRGRTAIRQAAQASYQDLLKTALQPAFYLEEGVPDTLEARAGWVSCLACVMIVRLQDIHSRESRRLQTALNDHILDGFDAAYRETGVGDAAIARKVRALAEHHYGMGKVIVSELHKPEPESGLARILERNGFTGPEKAAALAGYLSSALLSFRQESDAQVLAGGFKWPDINLT